MTRHASTPRWVVLAALALVAFNLRSVLTSVAPVEVDIQAATGWNDVTIGSLTTLPVLLMGVCALLVPWIARRVGRRRTVWLAMLVLTIAMTIRLAALVPGVLHLSAVLGGIGIALAAGLVPGIVREQMPDAIGSVTGLWTAAMFTGAALAAGLTVPLAHWTGSWQIALAVWAIPAALAWLVWTLVERPFAERGERSGGGLNLRELPWRNRTAWALTGYTMVNSIVFYSAIAWIATSYDERGWSQESSGLLFAVSSAGQIAAALALPWIAQRFKATRLLLSITTALTSIALLLIGVAPAFVPVLVLATFGFVHSGGFAVSLSLLSSYASDAAASARITAMTYFMTYLVAATGPIITGAIVQATDSWAIVFGFLAVLTLAQFPAIVQLRRGATIA